MAIRIDWSTAMVSPERNTLQLEVELTEEPDTFWANEFTRIRDEPRALELPPFYMASTPSHWSRKLVLYGLEPGSEDEVRKVLDAMVEEANEAAEEARRAWTEKKAKDAEDAERQEQAAKEMTERFRSPPS